MSTLSLGLTLKHSRSRGAARLVMIALADLADDDGVTSASLAEIACSARVALSTVPPALETLARLGEVDRVEAGRGKGKPTSYQINHAALWQNKAATVSSSGMDGWPETFAPWQTPLLEATSKRAVPEIPAGPQAEPDDEAGRDLKIAPEQSVDRQGPEGSDEVSFPSSLAVTPDEVIEHYSRHERPAAPQRPIPSHLPPSDVGRILAAAGVEIGDRPMLYWWQQEHKAELSALLARLGVSAEQLGAAIEASGRKMPDLARIGDLECYGAGSDG